MVQVVINLTNMYTTSRLTSFVHSIYSIHYVIYGKAKLTRAEMVTTSHNFASFKIYFALISLDTHLIEIVIIILVRPQVFETFKTNVGR